MPGRQIIAMIFLTEPLLNLSRKGIFIEHYRSQQNDSYQPQKEKIVAEYSGVQNPILKT